MCSRSWRVRCSFPATGEVTRSRCGHVTHRADELTHSACTQHSVCRVCLAGATTGTSAPNGAFRRHEPRGFACSGDRCTDACCRALGRSRDAPGHQRGCDVTCAHARLDRACAVLCGALGGGRSTRQIRALLWWRAGSVPSWLAVGSVRSFDRIRAPVDAVATLVITPGINRSAHRADSPVGGVTCHRSACRVSTLPVAETHVGCGRGALRAVARVWSVVSVR